MKIGFSFGRCIRDIVNDEVGYDDVAWIISGTALRDEEAVRFCIQDYMYRHDYLEGLDETTCMDVGIRYSKKARCSNLAYKIFVRFVFPKVLYGQTCFLPIWPIIIRPRQHGTPIDLCYI